MAAGDAGRPTETGDRPEVAQMEPKDALSRLAFVDVMRTVAVGRVVVNHALPWPWMKWFESLPVMFFASGLLVGRSLATRDWKAVFVGRFKRLAMPTGLYLAFAAVMTITNAMPGTTIHLWYVWTFLLFTALSGVFLRLLRWSRITTLSVVGVLVIAATIGPDQFWPFGVSGAYLLAWLAGMVWAEDGCRVPSVRALGIAVVVGSTAAIVSVGLLLEFGSLTSPSKLGIAMAGLGAAWLAIGLLLKDQLDGLLRLRGIGPFIRYLNKRLLTVYLWHVPATILGRDWADALGLEPFWNAWFVLLVTFVLTGLATVAFGGLEDRASASSKRVKARAEAARDAKGAAPVEGAIDLR